MKNTRSVWVLSALLLGLGSADRAFAQTYEIFHSFFIAGGAPSGKLAVAAGGVLYGTTQKGGTLSRGSVFSLTPDGSGGFTLLTLHSFAGPDGANPTAGLLFGPDGNLYGTTSAGGAAGFGTLFRISPAGGLTRLHDFADGGGQSPSLLLFASDGNLYGTASGGGAHGGGTVFRLDPNEAFATVHDFDGAVEGVYPVAGLVQVGTDLYGVTSSGGAQGSGTVFRLDLAGNLTTLHDFVGTDGAVPSAALVQGLDGNLYGTTRGGGSSNDGTVFKIDLSGTVTTLHSLTNYFDGAGPRVSLVQAGNGAFYGTAPDGGSPPDKDHFPAGSLFRVDAMGAFAELFAFAWGFTGSPGYGPASELVDGGDGFLYGTTTQPLGSVYRFDPGSGSVSFAYFFPADNPYYPLGPVTEANGALYGTASEAANGSVFRLEGSDARVLHVFNGGDGRNPTGGLLLASNGYLYGTTSDGGSAGLNGTAYRLSTDDTFQFLHEFGGSDGLNPVGGFIESPDGDFYGTTTTGLGSSGTIFHMNGSGTVVPVHTFSGPEGAAPQSSPIRATDGNLYGTTLYGGASGLGNIYKLDAVGTLTSLHEFQGPDGSQPNAGLIQATDGDFYGVTGGGGADNLGTLFRADTSGTVTTLHSFAGPDGTFPEATLLQAADGRLYGSAYDGGPADIGTIFRSDTLGNFELLHEFDGSDGSHPLENLIEASDGNLYGTTFDGGIGGGGVVFRLVFGVTSPSVAAILPASGRAAGGTPFVVRGDHLASVGNVSLGGVSATPPAIFDQGSAFTVSPALTPGTLNDVTVEPTGSRPAREAQTLPAAWFADFSDVSQDDIFHPYVETIFRGGITAGCGGGDYCRDDAVRRDQMAVFLLKAEHGSAYVPPGCTGVFPDVPCPGQFADWIERLAAEGVTAGCGGGNYCPASPVTRAQMAVFLLKAHDGSGYAPPPSTGLFGDVPTTDPFAPWIEELAHREITGGCQASPPLYCPANPNTRGQMAVFLAKTFPF